MMQVGCCDGAQFLWHIEGAFLCGYDGVSSEEWSILGGYMI